MWFSGSSFSFSSSFTSSMIITISSSSSSLLLYMFFLLFWLDFAATPWLVYVGFFLVLASFGSSLSLQLIYLSCSCRLCMSSIVSPSSSSVLYSLLSQYLVVGSIDLLFAHFFFLLFWYLIAVMVVLGCLSSSFTCWSSLISPVGLFGLWLSWWHLYCLDL